MSSPLEVDYYTDVLCVWAWIAQHRIDEIEKEWGERIRLRHHCVNVFGDTLNRIGDKWSDRGGYAGFAEHVEESAAPFEFAPINPTIWRDVRPYTSATAHMALKAAELQKSADDANKLAVVLRKSFFVEALDIGSVQVVLKIAGDAGFDPVDLESRIESGQALAALVADYERAREISSKGSPSWVLNNGRQILYGNVGYRILSANIEELLKSPVDE
ncbi:MAG: disulfide bond formation protein DsbA, partial [Gammaproteobacteria bacterium]